MADTVVVPYNVVPELDERVACVIVEPVAANMGLVAPAPGLPRGAARAPATRSARSSSSTRSSPGSGSGPAGCRRRWSGVTPDLWCFGKVIGGGLPVGAFGGRRDVLAVLAPDGPVYQAGTLSGNPLATAAGLAVLETVAAGDYDVLCARAARLAAGLEAAIAGAGIAGPGPGGGPARRPVLRGRARHRLRVGPGRGGGRACTRRSSRAMLERGVALAPGPYEAMFPGLAHLDDHLDAVVEAAAEAAAHVGRPSLLCGLTSDRRGPARDPWSRCS